MTPRRKRGAEPLGDLLQGFLKQTSAGREIARDALEVHWRETVGPEIAETTRVSGFRDGVLAVEVASSALLQELATFYGASILAALKERGAPLPEIRELRFKLGAF